MPTYTLPAVTVPSGTLYARLAAVQILPGASQRAVLITAANAGLLPPKDPQGLSSESTNATVINNYWNEIYP